MSDKRRFAAFSFVDEIVSIEVGKSIHGKYHIPNSISKFQTSLCCEAVGQCAAFSAMAALDFQYQPVAGISSRVDFNGQANPGDTIELKAEIASVDSEAVTYDGVGIINGNEVVNLQGCLGPMLPMAEFDDPENLRSRYQQITNGTAERGLFAGIPNFQVTTVEQTEEQIRGTFSIPETGDFFADHFPRKPVFPGTLFLNLCLEFGQNLLPVNAKPIGAYSTKLRDFMEPGDSLAIMAKVDSKQNDITTLGIYLEGGKRPKRMVKLAFQTTA